MLLYKYKISITIKNINKIKNFKFILGLFLINNIFPTTGTKKPSIFKTFFNKFIKKIQKLNRYKIQNDKFNYQNETNSYYQKNEKNYKDFKTLFKGKSFILLNPLFYAYQQNKLAVVAASRIKSLNNKMEADMKSLFGEEKFEEIKINRNNIINDNKINYDIIKKVNKDILKKLTQ